MACLLFVFGMSLYYSDSAMQNHMSKLLIKKSPNNQTPKQPNAQTTKRPNAQTPKRPNDQTTPKVICLNS